MTTIFNRRLEKFKQRLGDKTISDYFNLDPNLKITIHNHISEELYLLDIKYSKLGNIFLFPYLPYELNKSIAEFNDVNIHLTIEIRDTDNYPFKPPIWSILNIISNIYNIDKYYQFIINEFNKTLNRSWSPYLWCEKEILLFITIINNFEYFSIC